jgi:acetyl-CoA carboxylase biotin carboxylase subunit
MSDANKVIPCAARDIRRVFVANRGEISLRIIRACHALGIEAVLAVSEADTTGLPAETADETVLIGPAPATESYLDIDKIVTLAKAARCDAVHPGYGFLAERASFSKAVSDAGMVFIGPTAAAISQMGDKISAGQVAEAAGVPRVPGSGKIEDPKAARAFAASIGYPVLVKAAAGGGGRGMRVVEAENDMEAAFASAAKEAQSAFGDPTLFVEKYIARARHVEIQIMADDLGNVVHLGERDCSTQRRHQKLIEEAPSPLLDEATRAAMGEAAVRLTREADYCGAGTVEFVVDADTRAYYFLEMNTRIQVEHPVTEMVTGIDLVAEQIRVAGGLPLSFSQDDITITGHAIECRINAEDPDKNFMPRPGTITEWQEPTGTGVRIDSHCRAGAIIPPFYDSLIGKLIVQGKDRTEALDRMRAAIADFQVGGIPTTLSFHAQMMTHPDFINSKVTTTWVETVLMTELKAARKAAKLALKAANHG